MTNLFFLLSHPHDLEVLSESDETSEMIKYLPPKSLQIKFTTLCFWEQKKTRAGGQRQRIDLDPSSSPHNVILLVFLLYCIKQKLGLFQLRAVTVAQAIGCCFFTGPNVLMMLHMHGNIPRQLGRSS